MRAIKVLLLIFLCATPIQIATAQSGAKQNAEAANPTGRDGVIAGRIVTDAGQPASGAPILIIKAGVKITSGMQMATADDEGKFKVTGLGPGSYLIFPNVPGYVAARTSSEPDYRRPGENVTINLIKGGVIAGRVTDAYGEPMVGVRVQARKTRELEGGQQYLGEMIRMAGRFTDDRGFYRLYGLEPGVYVVGVSNDSTGLYGGGYPGREVTTWHPSSPRATATEFTVRSGEEIAGIDIRHREERGHTISGTVSGDTSVQGEGIRIMLTSGADRQLAGMTGAIGSKGFAMFGVPDGDYEIIAAVRMNAQLEFATSAPHRVVVKGADISGLELKIAPPASISGKAKLESSTVGSAPGAGKSPCVDGLAAKDRTMIEEVLLSATPEDQSQPSILSLVPEIRYFGGAMGGARMKKANSL